MTSEMARIELPARVPDAWRAAGAAVVGGVLLGAMGRGVDQFEARTIHWFSALGAPWLLAAFVIGAFVGRRRLGAAAGAGALAIGSLSYYAIFHFVEHKMGGFTSGAVGLAWAVGGIPAGAVFGWAGAAWWQRRGPLSTAAVAGALLGEALLLQSIWHRPLAMRVLVIEAIAGVLCALLLTRERSRALAMTAGVALLVVVAELVLRETARAAGWSGA